LAILASSLDVELGKGAAQLLRLCDDCILRLHQAGRGLDMAMLDVVIALLIALRDAWQKVEDRSV
jgi:flagellin-specific chaperone FliS